MAFRVSRLLSRDQVQRGNGFKASIVLLRRLADMVVSLQPDRADAAADPWLAGIAAARSNDKRNNQACMDSSHRADAVFGGSRRYRLTYSEGELMVHDSFVELAVNVQLLIALVKFSESGALWDGRRHRAGTGARFYGLACLQHTDVSTGTWEACEHRHAEFQCCWVSWGGLTEALRLSRGLTLCSPLLIPRLGHAVV